MSPEARRKWTLTTLIAGATLVASSFGALVNGVVTLDRKLGASTTAQDSLFANDSTLFARMARLERRMGVRGGGRATARPHQEGLIRKFFRLLF